MNKQVSRQVINNKHEDRRIVYKFDLDDEVWGLCLGGLADITKGDIFYMDEPDGERVKDADGFEVFIAIKDPYPHVPSGRMQVDCMPLPNKFQTGANE